MNKMFKRVLGFFGLSLGVKINQHYKVECFGPDGKLKWLEEFDNLVVDAGLDKYLDATLKTGLASPAWYVGLKDTGTVADADTMGSHAGWAELTVYSNANRPTWTAGTIGDGTSGRAIDNSGSKAVFNINASDDVYGAFMADNSTKGGTSGTLLGAGDFTAPRAVQSGDTLNVTVTCELVAS